jgi:hypothetical protein
MLVSLLFWMHFSIKISNKKKELEFLGVKEMMEWLGIAGKLRRIFLGSLIILAPTFYRLI